MLNEQLQLVLTDEERAIAALPKLLPADEAAGLEVLRKLARAAGAPNAEGEHRLARVEKLFGAKPTKARKGNG